MRKTWFSLKASATPAEPVEVSIYDDIGAWGVTAKDFIAAIKPYKGTPMTLAINSNGGDVFAGITIYNALRMHGADVTVRVMGVAASAASLIAMAGTKIVMPENTFMMVHNPWTFAAGNADDFRDIADMLDKIGGSLVSTYVARTGKTEDEVKQLLADETWLTAAEAVDAGFADEVEAVLKIAASFDPEDPRLPEKVRAVLARKPEAPAPDVADAIQAAVNAAGLGEFVAVFAADPTLVDPPTIAAAVETARLTQKLAALAGAPELAAGLIRARAPLDKVRQALQEHQAEQDADTVVNTAAPSKPAAKAGDGISAGSIWADINAMTNNRSKQ